MECWATRQPPASHPRLSRLGRCGCRPLLHLLYLLCCLLYALCKLLTPLLSAPTAPPLPLPCPAAQAIDKRRSAAERELHGSLRVLARHLPQEQYEALAEGLAVSCGALQGLPVADGAAWLAGLASSWCGAGLEGAVLQCINTCLGSTPP